MGRGAVVFPRRRLRRLPAALAFASALFLPALFRAGAADAPLPGPGFAGETAQAGDAARRRIARSLHFHDFENRRDPETGRPLPESSDLDNDDWPDFWEPIRGVGYPEYLIHGAAIGDDDRKGVAGAYRDAPNRLLRMAFDGSRVGVRTRFPLAVDSSRSYEFSLMERDRGLYGAVIRAGVEWLRADAFSSAVVGRDEIPDFLPGQEDWPVAPRSVFIKDVPAEANAARLFVVVEGEPEAIEKSYDAELRFDDVRLRPLPKISAAVTPGGAGQASPALELSYAGLVDNIPDPGFPGRAKGKRYRRTVDIADVFNRPAAMSWDRGRRLDVGAETGLRESLALPALPYGVYYASVRLYDADDRLTAESLQAFAVAKPPPGTADRLGRSVQPSFGVRLDAPPPPARRRSGWLRDAVAALGMASVKLWPWPDQADPAYGAYLASELRLLRSSGIRAAGVVKPPEDLFPGSTLAGILRENPDGLTAILRPAAENIGLLVDSWQLGDDPDDSLAAEGPDILKPVGDILAEFSGGLPVIGPAGPGAAADPPAAAVLNRHFPPGLSGEALWREAAPVFPWLFEPYLRERGATYPPAGLSALAPPPPPDPIEAQRAEERRRRAWISLELSPVSAEGQDISGERRQAEDLMIRAAYAAALKPDTIFLGRMFGKRDGLLRPDAGSSSPQHSARPAFLAAATVAEHLSGASYLGEWNLLPPFEAHAFKRASDDGAVIMLWHNAGNGELRLERPQIAAGLDLAVTDWAGNRRPLGPSVPVRRLPVLITGMTAGMALTRMSVRISPEPPMLSRNARQNQILEMVNHMPLQATARFRLRYAARANDGGMEPGWEIRPEELSANLLPATPDLKPSLLNFTASPDVNSPIQAATPEQADKDGRKLVQAQLNLITSRSAEMALYPDFRLLSDLDVDIVRIPEPEEGPFATIQLRIRWFPPDGRRRRGEISVMPFFMKKGEMREFAAVRTAVKASPPGDRGRQDVPYETVELRIPRRPARQTWIGLAEESGSDFYLADVTGLLSGPAAE